MLVKDSAKIKEKARINNLVDQYGTSAFMYTQYPHKRFWSVKNGDEEYKSALLSLGKNEDAPPSLLYIHIPYCQQLCYFCTCHMSITNNYNKVKGYIIYRSPLKKSILVGVRLRLLMCPSLILCVTNWAG